MLVDLKCTNCGKEKKDVLINCVISSDQSGVDLKDLGIICDKCKGTVFKKLIVIPGRMPVQWSQWNTKK